MREYAARRDWSVVAQIKEIGSGASQRELRETLIAAVRRRDTNLRYLTNGHDPALQDSVQFAIKVLIALP